MGNPQTSLELPARGTITHWVPADSIGRIRLASGEEIRFGHSACVGVRPAVGLEVWVVEVQPHPLGGLRAKVLNASGERTPDRATAALSAHQERERRRPEVEKEVEAIKAECAAALAKKPGPWAVATAAGIADLAAIEALRARMPRDEAAALVSSIPAIAKDPALDLRLYDLEWIDTFAHFEVWTDPSFIPFAAEGGNQLGIFAHPAALSQALPAPVLMRIHEQDPVFAWVAESAPHFVRMLDGALAGADVEGLRGERFAAVDALVDATQHEPTFEDLEREDVHALLWSGSRALELAAAERLENRYRDRGWKFPLASIEAQRALAGWQDRIDVASAKLEGA